MTTYVYWLRGPGHRDMLLRSARSIAKNDAGAAVVALVDDDTPLAQHGLDVVRLPELGREPPMVANLAAQTWFLEHRAADGEAVTFLDADTLLLRPVAFDAPLGVTWRRHEGLDDDGQPIVGVARFMPYNYGVLGARVTGATRGAFRWLYERVRAMAPRWQEWYGNQLALAALVGPAPAAGTLETTRVVRTLDDLGELEVERRPCALFNHTPAALDEELAGVHLLHFKGRRRPLMAPFAERLGIP